MLLAQSLTSKLGKLYVLGSYNVDIVSEVAAFPKPGETIRALSTQFYSGGKGSNQATAAARVSDGVHFCTKIGQDTLSARALEHFDSLDLESATVLQSPDVPTGNAFIMLSNETRDNMITLDLGANLTISKQEIAQELPKVACANTLLVQLENNLSSVEQVLSYAKENQILTILNPAPYCEEVVTLLSFVDVITPNETEAECLSGIAIVDIESAKRAAQRIYVMGPSLVIITLGAKGCLVFDGQEYKRYLSYNANVVDTCGAGDSFNGALAASLSNGTSVQEAISYASAFASLAVERRGASNMPTHLEVRERLSQQGR